MEAEDLEQITKTFKPGLAQGGLQDGVANPGGDGELWPGWERSHADGGDSAKLSTAMETAAMLELEEICALHRRFLTIVIVRVKEEIKPM